MIRCPHCNSLRTRVIGTATGDDNEMIDYKRRHRKCAVCHRNFFTREHVEGIVHLEEDDIRVALSFLVRAAETLRKGRKNKRR